MSRISYTVSNGPNERKYPMIRAMFQFAWPVLKPIAILCGLCAFIGLTFGLIIAG